MTDNAITEIAEIGGPDISYAPTSYATYIKREGNPIEQCVTGVKTQTQATVEEGDVFVQ